MNTFQRRLAIVAYLHEKGFATSRELAERFEVSKQTIKHDLNVLNDPDIFSVIGRKGGYRYLGPRNVELSEREAEAVRRLTEANKDEFSEDVYYALLAKFKRLDNQK